LVKAADIDVSSVGRDRDHLWLGDDAVGDGGDGAERLWLRSVTWAIGAAAPAGR
jgi:hypothetical protein